MIRIFTLPVLLFTAIGFFSCHKNGSTVDNPTIGNWVRRADFDGMPRSQAITMVIGDTAYTGTGTDGVNYMKDLWRYDAVNNNWAQRADLPGNGRAGAVGFSVGSKGYTGTGYNGAGRLKDLWEYNPSVNQWTRKTDFAGTARSGAVAFTINDRAYITTGFDGNDLNDFFEYHPAGDTSGAAASPWLVRQDMPGAKRSGAVAFVYMGKGYICTGASGTGASFAATSDMWAFDPAIQSWSKRRSITDASPDSYDDKYAIIRKNAVAFVMNGHAYITCGENGSILKDTWEYDFATDLWLKKTDFEGVERTSAVGFSVLNRGFVTGGNNSKYHFDDLREFIPEDTYNVND